MKNNIVYLIISYIFDKEIKQIEIMKSLLFKSAWNIFRISNVTFSEALSLAWAKIKSGVKAVIVKSNKLVKSAGLGYETVYFNELVFTQIVISRTVCNNSGARHDYGIGAYNGD